MFRRLLLHLVHVEDLHGFYLSQSEDGIDVDVGGCFMPY